MISSLRIDPVPLLLLLSLSACQSGPQVFNEDAANQEHAQVMGRSCPGTGSSSQPFSFALPARTVRIEGQIPTDAVKLRLISVRSGVAHNLWLTAMGRFMGEVAPGAYHATLHGQNNSPGVDLGPLDIKSSTASLQFAACALDGCRLPLAAIPGAEPAKPLATARVLGEVTFVDAFDAPLTLGSPVDTTVTVHFIRRGEGASSFPNVVSVNNKLRFDASALPYGTYEVNVIASSGVAASPAGRWKFDAPLVVAQPEINWQGTVPTREVLMEIDVNGLPMPSNGQEGDRGYVELNDADGLRMAAWPIGPQGPARLSVTLIPGIYLASLQTYEPVGHGLLRGLDQDVLPTGNLELGRVEVGVLPAPIAIRRDISVRSVRLSVPGDLKAVSFAGPGMSFSWAATPQTGATALIYGGCQTALRGLAEGPDTSAFDVDEKSLGEVCVPCD